jgi:hypothetical protein
MGQQMERITQMLSGKLGVVTGERVPAHTGLPPGIFSRPPFPERHATDEFAGKPAQRP